MAKRKRRKLKKSALLFLVLCGLLVIGVGYRLLRPAAEPEETAAPPTPTPEPEPQVYTAKLFLTGDALIHGTVWMDADRGDGTYDFSGILENVGRLSEGYDLKYYNQETILGGTELGLHGYPRFNSPQEVGDAMVGMGFNLVSTANNHSLDKDEEGIRRSVEYWKQQEAEHGVHMAGTYLSWEEQQAIPVYEVNGITYTFLSWTYGCNGLYAPAGMEYLVNVYPGREEELLNQVRQANEISDLVIVAMHWGTEYSMEANDEQRSLARQLHDAGADIIIGNHPHVIQPIEWIDDTICYYAMGNMVSAQIEEPNLVGMYEAVTITKTVTGDHTEVKVSDAKADLFWTYYHEGYYNFKVIPFDELDDAHLPGHDMIYEKYKTKITEYDESIQVGGIRLE